MEPERIQTTLQTFDGLFQSILHISQLADRAVHLTGSLRIEIAIFTAADGNPFLPHAVYQLLEHTKKYH